MLHTFYNYRNKPTTNLLFEEDIRVLSEGNLICLRNALGIIVDESYSKYQAKAPEPSHFYCLDIESVQNRKVLMRTSLERQLWFPTLILYFSYFRIGNRLDSQGGGPSEKRILAGYYVFNANISFTFEAIKNLYVHFTYLCFGSFCKFFGDF